MDLDFRPPRESRWILGFTHRLLPVIMRAARRIVAVSVPESDWPHLERLRGGRAILAPNHPTTSDPLIAMFLSRRLSEAFNYVACRELFHGPYGWLIQRLGAYSFLRGLPDRASIKMTRRLLAELDHKVVIFPEGETYEYNDLTIPFQPGAIQIAFWALDDLHRLGREPVLPVLPVVVKYRCVADARPAIDAGLRSLESALSLSPVLAEGRYGRLRRVGGAVLGRIEQEYGIRQPAGMPLAERITAAKVTVLERVARDVGVTRPAELSLPEQMRRMFNAVYQYVEAFADGADDYARRQHARRMAAAYPLLLDLWRLENLIAVTDGYVAEQMTAERFLDVIGRLQREVLGRVRHRVPREAIVRLVPPTDVGSCYEEYRRSRRETVVEVTARIESSVRALLAEMATLGKPIEE